MADLEIYPQSWKVYKAGREIKMPNREFELLKFLAEHPNIVFSKDRLFETIWGFDYVGDSATVTVHVGRIRDKIEDDPSKPRIIETVWGAGYRLNAKGSMISLPLGEGAPVRTLGRMRGTPKGSEFSR